jgi:hypothetical protein
LSRAVYQILQHADGDRSLGELLDTVQVASDREVVATELVELWTQRLLQLLPVARSIAARGGHSRQTA